MRHTFSRGLRAANAAAGAALAAIATTALLPASATADLQAQPGGVASACTIDGNAPKELALVSLRLNAAAGNKDFAARRPVLVAMMKDLETKPERFKSNLVGYHYTRSQVLTLMGADSAIGFMPTRGSIGLGGAPDEKFDLVGALDSDFKAVVAGSAACEKDVGDLRQNDVWLALTRRALDASNANQPDTAMYYAQQSLRLSTASPYPHYVLGNVVNAKGDKAAAVGHWKQVVTLAGNDSTYRDLRNSSLYFIGAAQVDLAEKMSGAEKQTAARDAAASFKQLIDAAPNSADMPNAMQAMAEALTVAGDSSKVATVYAPLMAANGDFSDFAYTMGGVIATRANKLEDATVMFESAVKKNPTARDALRNLAATYYARNQYQKMFDPSAKLVAIDPNNKDGWMMFAYGYQGLMQGTKVAAEKKAFGDSLVKYQTYAEAMPAKVDVKNFQRGANAVTLVLELEQQAAKAGTYEVTAEFLDAKGAVVAKDTQSVGPIEKGKTATVTLKATGDGIAGYRYLPIK
ncbi:MAG TPA: hypothetical protein VE869_05250 [Gemmatimonas sp.]|nr:hypothetical protein [Gemmatimonas sp.]